MPADADEDEQPFNVPDRLKRRRSVTVGADVEHRFDTRCDFGNVLDSDADLADASDMFGAERAGPGIGDVPADDEFEDVNLGANAGTGATVDAAVTAGDPLRMPLTGPVTAAVVVSVINPDTGRVTASTGLRTLPASPVTGPGAAGHCQ